MTNQEARDLLLSHIHFLQNSWKPYPDRNVLEALSVAISALEKQIHEFHDV